MGLLEISFSKRQYQIGKHCIHIILAHSQDNPLYYFRITRWSYIVVSIKVEWHQQSQPITNVNNGFYAIFYATMV